MKLINIGYGNTVNSDRVIAAVSADAAPVKRIISAAKDNNTAIDATCGKKTKTVIITDSNHVVLSALDISHFTGITAEQYEQRIAYSNFRTVRLRQGYDT